MGKLEYIMIHAMFVHCAQHVIANLHKILDNVSMLDKGLQWAKCW